jgi:hypothetical protein
MTDLLAHLISRFQNRPTLSAFGLAGLMVIAALATQPIAPANAQNETPAPAEAAPAQAAPAQRAQIVPPNPVARPADITSNTPLVLEDGAAPLLADPGLDTNPADTAPALAAPSAPEDPSFTIVPPDSNANAVPVRFMARLTDDGPTLERDLIWTVYGLNDSEVTNEDLALNAQGGTLESALPPGSYIVHVSYGLATLSRPLTISSQGIVENFTLRAGGMSLRGAISANDYLPDELVHFQVFAEGVDGNEDDTPVIDDVDERTVLVVPAGRYTVVSRYGNENSTVRAQIDVEAGQLTEAVMFHQAAQITLKLVNEPNGEALPGTSWSVLNPGGDVVSEFIGAFPTMVLTEGEYTIIARHDGQVFSRDFAVVAGVDRDEELVAE